MNEQTIMDNPFLETYHTPHHTHPFDRIRMEHYKPAFHEGMKRQNAEIDAIDMSSGPAINAAKERLAFELTSLVHSPEEAQKAMDTARSLFGGGADAADMPSTVLDPALVGETGIGILDLLTEAGLVPSKGEGRRLIQQGGIALDGEKVTDPMSVVSRDRLEQGVVVKKGKKVYHKVSL